MDGSGSDDTAVLEGDVTAAVEGKTDSLTTVPHDSDVPVGNTDSAS